MKPAMIQAVSKTLQKPTTAMTVSGVIEKNSEKNQLLIKTASGTIPVNVDSSRFSNGDPVVLTMQNGSFRLEKSGVKIDNIEIDKDTFLKNTTSTVRLTDILDNLKQSVISGESSLISESVKTALDLINDKAALSGIDKTLLAETIKAINIRLEQTNTLSKDAMDSLLILKNALQNIITLKPESTAPSFGLTAASSLKNGIHLIPIDTLVTLIDKNSDNQQVKKLLEPFRDISDTIAVRVSGDTQKKIITPITGSSLQREFQSLINGMKSSLLQSIPPDSLELLLFQKGSIDLDTLVSLDNQIVNVSTRFAAERAGSRNAAAAVITSWLSMSMDNIGSSSQSVKFPPVLPQSLQNDIESITLLLKQSVLNIAAKMSEGTGITETLITAEPRPNALPLSFSKLGFDNESQMLHTNTSASNIKTELLKLLSDTTTSGYAGQNKTGSVSDLRAALSSLNNFTQSLDTKNVSSQNILQSGIVYLTNLRDQLTHIIPQSQLQTLTDNFDKAIRLFMSFKGSSTELLTQLKEKAEFLLNGVVTRLMETVTHNESLKDKTVAEQFRQTSPDVYNVETMLKIRSTVESAINKLESLQLLARQTPLADGSQQQILALPMKIGNEWTELNVRFLKKEASQTKSKKSGSSFTVQINLAPSNIGAVSVKMDYLVKKSLKITMDIEKDTTRIFFQKNNAAIKNAIAELGLPVFSVDIKKTTEKSEVHNEKVLEQLIDVKV